MPAARIAAFVVAGPVLELGVGPFVLTGYETADGLPDIAALRALGVLLAVGGIAVVAAGVLAFATRGHGTPSPLSPTQRLVAEGAYRHVRHPMYLATALAIAGQGLALGQPILLVAAAAYLLTMSLFAWRFEEPALRRRFGPAYDAYRDAVPGWLPRRW